MPTPRDLFRIVGTVIDEKYRVDGVLGEGGCGVVYAGTHLLLGQPIAIKCMKPLGQTAAEEEAHAALFLREAKVLFTLTHPGIVRLYDIGVLHTELHQVPYVILERIDGRSLEQEIAARAAAARPFDAREILAIFEPVLEALAFAHGRGVAHRDMKPSNIMLLDAPGGAISVKLVDFGVARWTAEPSPSSGRTGFTPLYAAPEQWDRNVGESGPATDVFSLALVLEEACTLQSPLRDADPMRIFVEVMKGTRRPNLQAARPDLTGALDGLLERATRLDPRARYAGAAELLTELRAALSGAASQPRAASSAPAALSAPPALSVAASAHVQTDALDATMPAPAARAAASVPRVNETGAPLSETLPHAAPPPRSRRPIAIAAAVVLAASAVFVARVTDRHAPEGPATAAHRAAVADAAASAAAATRAPPPDPLADASVAIASLSAGAALPGDAARQLAENNAPALGRCYREALGRNAALSGNVTLLVTAAPSGKVFLVEDLDQGTLDPDTLRDAGLRVCLTNEIAQWAFPTHEKPDVSGVLYTLQFTRAGSPKPREPDTGTNPIEGAYTSVFILDPHEVYPPAPVEFAQRGSRVLGDYPDGVVACNRLKEELSCRWIQTDHKGGARLKQNRNGTILGRWGYEMSDSNGGSWRLTPRKR